MTNEESKEKTDFWEKEVDRLGEKGQELNKKEIEFLCDWVIEESESLEKDPEYCDTCGCTPCDCDWGN